MGDAENSNNQITNIEEAELERRLSEETIFKESINSLRSRHRKSFVLTGIIFGVLILVLKFMGN